MAQLYFYYSAMNAGKSTSLLQSSYNYNERGMRTVIFTAEIDNRFAQGKVSSRIGLSAEALVYSTTTDMAEVIKRENQLQKVHCVLIDECQFLTKKQVEELCDIVDNEDIPVLCYGLRTDFAGQLFAGSQYLLAWVDKLVELKTVCYCGRKANKVLRIGSDGIAVYEGAQVDIGGNEKYISVCRKHYSEAIKQAQMMNEGIIPKKPIHFR
ncbi:thymidine kinase [Providencia rettgeri]|uniref:Thymidine kinase n=1 Tax=Providencia rettgeri TaxID=587 RepID=A0AAP2JZS2_PRORE|nr:thymidine kinase [Providencia rettgeri]MBX6952909.1 thymidine kinase [Providencia rettgeri]MBX6957140.1 thymidine kinase [Providencia rettgeri]MBX6962192.1 thymidine kinase [Providencia rettgeri]MBX6972733.1 thymidine kinase [Providencia rettgeri]MBX6981097.1 thymidine kinase [Providencia rettgeri]